MNTNKPLISIIVLNYNGATFLDVCIGSVFNCNYPKEKLQVIVVDNGSTDNSIAVLKGYGAKIHLIRNKVNNCCIANNLAIEKANGQFIVLMNNDVKVDEEWLNELLEVMNRNEDCGIVGSKILFADGRIQSTGHERFSDYTWGDRGLLERNRGVFNDVDEVESVSNCSAMFRAKALEEVGPLDEDFMMYLEEVDIALRMKAKRWTVLYCPESIAYHRLHGSEQGPGKIDFYNLRNRMYVMVKHFWEQIGGDFCPVKEIVHRDVSSFDKYLIPLIDKINKTHAGYIRKSLLDVINSLVTKNEAFIKFHLRSYYHRNNTGRLPGPQKTFRAYNNVIKELGKYKDCFQLYDDFRTKTDCKRKKQFSIAVITDHLSFYGGKEVYTLESIKEWSKNCRVTVYTASINKKLVDDFELRNVNVKILNSPKMWDPYYRLNMLFFMPKVWEDEIGIHDIYVIHSTNGTLLSSIELKPCVVICHEPLRTIYDLRNFGNYSSNKKAVRIYGAPETLPIDMNQNRLLAHLGSAHDSAEKCFSEDFRKYTANSYFTSQYMESIYGIKDIKTVYPGGHSVPQRHPLPKDTVKKIVFIGSLERHKQPRIAVKAMKYISNAKLIIIGQGGLKHDLDEMIEELKLNNRVKIYSDISTKKKEQLLRSSYCVLFMPLREPFGIAVVEAMSYARPLVVSEDSAGYKEVLPAGAYLSAESDPVMIAEKINLLLSDPKKAEMMGKIAWRASKKLTWKRTSKELLDLFHKTSEEYLNYSVLGKEQLKNNNKPLVGALYFAWYNAKTGEHWGDNPRYGNVCDTPQNGIYTSASRTIIKNQLDKMGSAGIDFIAINWTVTPSGVSKSEEKTTKTILELIKQKKMNIRICILLSIYTTHPEPLNKALEKYSKISSDKAYFNLAGKKPLFVFITPSFFYSPYLKIKEFIESYNDNWLIAGSLFPIENNIPEHMIDLFNGNYISSPASFSRDKHFFLELEKEYRIACSRKGNIRIFPVSPGYDDRHLDDPDRAAHEIRYVSRESGKMYRRMWNKALKVRPSPEIIMIDSYNEYHETTHIETSEKYGDKFMKITKEYISKLKGV